MEMPVSEFILPIALGIIGAIVVFVMTTTTGLLLNKIGNAAHWIVGLFEKWRKHS